MTSGVKNLFLLTVLLILIFTLPAYAEGDNLLNGADFESDISQESWEGGAQDSSASFSGENGYVLSNPFGEVSDSLVTHVLEYSDTVFLEEGKIYTLSGYVMNPCGEDETVPRSRAVLSDDSRIITFKINNIGSSWQQFSTTFYVSESNEYELSFYFENGNEFVGFFVDELSLCVNPLILSSMQIHGREKVLIPADGCEKIRYSPVLYANDGTTVGLLSLNALYFSATECSGVEFNQADATLSVTSSAQNDTSITINCSLENSQAVSPTSLTIYFTDNLIENSDFENAEASEYWQGESSINTYTEDNGSFIGTDTNSYGKRGYYTVIHYSVPQMLVGGAVYVLHTKIKSNCPVDGTSLYQNNTEVSDDGTVIFNISDICSNTWQNVTAAFVPESSGIYNIAISLWSRYDCTVFLDDIMLCSELLRPTYITVHAPGNIALPDVETQYPASAFVRDQLGNIIEGATCQLSFSASDDFVGDQPVSFDDSTGMLTILPDSSAGDYTLTASYEGEQAFSSSITVTVSQDYVGDGSFEYKSVNEWWMASSPGEYNFMINDNGTDKYASLESNGAYLMLLNNSYMHLIYDVPYVFTATVNSASQITVTAFLEISGGEAMPLVQFSVLGRSPVTELFLPTSSSVGRLLLYFQSDDDVPFSVNIDNIALKKAIVSASGASMSGNLTVNGTATAEFSFFNNVAGYSDASACVINWYISDSQNGEYTQLPESGKYIYFDTSFAEKYVYFEVTPICPQTGFSGSPVRCLPQRISFDYGGGGVIEDVPKKTDVSPLPQKSEITPIKLSESYTEDFSDTATHWCRNYAGQLKQAGVISGRDGNIFDPDTTVSRCEYAKMLCLAFGISEEASENIFSDVPPDCWYRNYVTALYKSGITSGVSDTLFAPDKAITRQEAVVFLMRIYEKYKKETVEVSSYKFYDDAQIASWAHNAVYSAVLLQITDGTPEGVFLPCDFTTRAEAAALITRTLSSMASLADTKG